MSFSDMFTSFPSRRSVVHSTSGIVSTISPLANEAGLNILRDGGNAADAAIAAAAVLNLVDPSMTGIGGDVFCLYYEASTRKVHAMNGSGRSAAGRSIQDVFSDLRITNPENASIPLTSGISVTVPGAAAAWMDVVASFGSGTLSLGDILSPAVEMARSGVPISEIASYFWVQQENELKQKPNGTELLQKDRLAGGYRAPRPGEVYKNPLLADTFDRLGTLGKKGFYEGPVAEAIITAVQDQGGYLTLDDLKRHGELGSEVTEAIPFRLNSLINSKSGIDLWEHPPNGQGIVAQMALGILQILQNQGKIPMFKKEDHNSAEYFPHPLPFFYFQVRCLLDDRYLHALISALRIAFADGTSLITDSSPSPASLLSQDHLTSRAALYSPTALVGSPDPPTNQVSDTVYLAVTDSDGNACSLVNSVADTFGSRIVPRGTGFVLQNRGAGFHLFPPTHPNIYAPSKRPYNTIIPALVTDAQTQSLRTVFGVMGGAMQPQGHVQVLLNMEVFGLNEQAALDAPRICIGVTLPGKGTREGGRRDERVFLEEGISEGVAKDLSKMGYEVVVVTGMGRALFGRGQVIRVREEDGEDGVVKVYSAGSDGRGDGAAAPLVRKLD